MSSPSRLQMDATVAATSADQGNHRRFTVDIDGVTYIVGGREPSPREYRAPDEDEDEDEAFYRDLTVPAVEERVPLFLRTVDEARIPPFLRAAAAAWGRTEEHQEQINISYKRARVPASSKAILGLKEVSAGDTKTQAECAVCLQDFDAEDKLRAMPCSHAFHQDCIFRWLRLNHVCPLCRHALPTQQPEDDDEEGNNQQARLPVPEEA